MAGGYEVLLPHNWSKVLKNKKGAIVECYENKKTGQMFYTKEDYERYMRYVLSNRESLSISESSISKNKEEKLGEGAASSAAVEESGMKQEAYDAEGVVSGAASSAPVEVSGVKQEAYDKERAMSGQFAGPRPSRNSWCNEAGRSKAVSRDRFASRK